MKKRISLLLGLSLLCVPSTQLHAVNWRTLVPVLVGGVVGVCAWKYDKNADTKKKAIYSGLGALGSWLLIHLCLRSSKRHDAGSSAASFSPSSSASFSPSGGSGSSRSVSSAEEAARCERLQAERERIADIERKLAMERREARDIETAFYAYLGSLGKVSVDQFVQAVQNRQLTGLIFQNRRTINLRPLLGRAQVLGVTAAALVNQIQRCLDAQPGSFNQDFN